MKDAGGAVQGACNFDVFALVLAGLFLIVQLIGQIVSSLENLFATHFNDHAADALRG